MKRWREIERRRHGGFTLVELLIVIMIIAILAGMLMLATGSATDSAEATKIINDLRNLRAVALLYYIDTNRWPTTADANGSFDHYTDRAIKYELKVASYTTLAGDERQIIGLVLPAAKDTIGIRNKIKVKATESGIVNATGGAYDGASGTDIYMPMR